VALGNSESFACERLTTWRRALVFHQVVKLRPIRELVDPIRVGQEQPADILGGRPNAVEVDLLVAVVGANTHDVALGPDDVDQLELLEERRDDPSTVAGQQQVNFFLGTYLLLKGNETYLNIDYGGGVQYYPQYELNLGTAVTPLPSDVSAYLWNGVYRRDFQNGFVLVNPGSTTYTLNLGGNYQLVQGSGGGPMTNADLDTNAKDKRTARPKVTGIFRGGATRLFVSPSD
jgi:hypothetical protein